MTACRPGFLYFFKPVGLEGPVKIGFSKMPEERRNAYAAWSPFPLELIGQFPAIVPDEAHLHDRLFNSHSHGEWFLPTEDVWTVIRRLASGETVAAVIASMPYQGCIRTSGLGSHGKRTWKVSRGVSAEVRQ